MPPERTPNNFACSRRMSELRNVSLSVADCNRSGSPNPNALFRCDEHRVGGLDFEGVVPDIGISSGTNHTKLTRGMRVAYDLLFDVIICDFSAPGLRPPEKHALITGVTIDYWRGLSFERSAIGVEGERETTQIGDIFAHGQFSVHMDPRN